MGIPFLVILWAYMHCLMSRGEEWIYDWYSYEKHP